MDSFECYVQRKAAEKGEAINQCPECLAYRLDNKPPVLHSRGCSKQPTPEEMFGPKWPDHELTEPYPIGDLPVPNQAPETPRVKFLQIEDFSRDTYLRLQKLMGEGKIPNIYLHPPRPTKHGDEFFSVEIPYSPHNAFTLGIGELVIWAGPRTVFRFMPDDPETGLIGLVQTYHVTDEERRYLDL